MPPAWRQESQDLDTPARSPQSTPIVTPSPVRRLDTFASDDFTPSPPQPCKDRPRRSDTLQSVFLGSDDGSKEGAGRTVRKTKFNEEEKEQIKQMTSAKDLFFKP